MSIYEIERKFLLSSEKWRKDVVRSHVIEQYYVDLTNVRFYFKNNFLIIKYKFNKLKLKLKGKELTALKLNIKNLKKVLRIRKFDDKFLITIKVSTNEIGKNIEIERFISLNIYKSLKIICDKGIEKTRHIIYFNNYKFEIDEFNGNNKGLILSEVEVLDIREPKFLPDWIGDEVTGNPEYFNDNLAKK